MVTRKKLMNSKLHDVNRWSEHQNVVKIVAHLMEVFGFKDRRYASCLRVLILDLYMAWRLHPEMYIAYPREESKYRKGTRFYSRRYGFDVMMKAVDALWQAKYIQNEIGGDRLWDCELEQYYKAISRMRSERKLIRLIVKHRIKTGMVARSEHEDVIVQRTEVVKEKKGNKTVKKKYEIEFAGEPPNVIVSRQRLKEYNALLADAYIDVDDENLTAEEKTDIRHYDLDLTRKRVYRIFSNGKWDEGGRFYRAWWMECPKILRKYIVINGDYTVELDYSGIHIHLLYAMKGINYAERREDPYVLDGFPHRKLNKLVFLTAINAKDDHNAVLGVWDQLWEKGKPMPYGISGHAAIHGIIEALRKKHPAIKCMIASGEGVKLQYIDSQIAEQVIYYFTQRKIPILTVHDSFICSAIDEAVLLDRMRVEFSAAIKQYLDINCVSVLDEVHWFKGDVSNRNNGDAMIAVDKQSISLEQYYRGKDRHLNDYKQGRRYNRYIKAGTVNTVARVSNAH